MDSAIATAARALAQGDPVTALRYVALRTDGSALAVRGIAMAQLGELADARKLLRRAARSFGPGEPLAQARCVLADAEVALALRDLGKDAAELETATAVLAARGDFVNASFAKMVQARRFLLLGDVERAERELRTLTLDSIPPRVAALGHLATADVALRRADAAGAEAALVRARLAAAAAKILPLRAEVEKAQAALRAPVARAVEGAAERSVSVAALPEIWSSGKLVVDVCRREARRRATAVSLVTRPVLLELLAALAEATPEPVPRDELIRRAFGARRIDDSHRVRLRVELGRLRKLMHALADVRARGGGYELAPHGAVGCILLLPPTSGEGSAVLAMLRGGEAWATSALAAALGKSQRAVQRALSELERDGKVRSVGRGRARRWVAAPTTGFATTLLLVDPAALQ